MRTDALLRTTTNRRRPDVEKDLIKFFQARSNLEIVRGTLVLFCYSTLVPHCPETPNSQYARDIPCNQIQAEDMSTTAMQY